MFDDFIFYSSGHNVSEVENLWFNWLDTDRYLFLYIVNPCEVNGALTKENGCIIYEINHARDYRTKENYINSYVGFYVSDEVFKSFAIKPNVVFYPSNYEEINSILKKISAEDARRGLNHNQLIYGCVLELLSTAGRGIAPHNAEPKNKNREIMEKIRGKYLSDVKNPPDIEELICASAFSRTVFYRMYQDFFHNSPKNDLIWERLQKSRELMRETSLKIYEIAEICGFDNVGHFSRLFKKRYGYTPKNYMTAVAKERLNANIKN